MLALVVGNLALTEAALGVPSRADGLVDDVIARITAIGAQRTPAGVVIQLAAGERARRGGDLREAASWFQAAIDAMSGMPKSAWQANAYLLLAGVQRDVGEGAAALASLDSAQRVLDRLADPGDLELRCHRLRAETVAPVRTTSQFGEQLSDRELDVLRLAAAGLGQRQIADQLFISYNTVKSHLKTSYRKLGVTSREEAVARFVELGVREGQAP